MSDNEELSQVSNGQTAVNGDGRASRLESLLNSKLFREELQRVINEQEEPNVAVEAIIREAGSFSGPKNGVKPIRGAATGAVVPVFDLRGFENSGKRFSLEEKSCRCALAAFHRLVDLFAWNGDLCHRITARNLANKESFLVAPYGMLASEVTASSLVALAVSNLKVLDAGTTNYGPRADGNLALHSAIYRERADINCVVHLHTTNVVAVSAMKQGLLPLSQDSCLLGKVAQCDFGEKDLIGALGKDGKVALIRNQGAVCCGESVAEAFMYVYQLVVASAIQLSMVPLGLDNLSLVDSNTSRHVHEVGMSGGGGVNSKEDIKWGVGEMEFEALLRLLDNAGFRTGHTYKQPLVRGNHANRLGKETELPPSLSFLLDEDNLYKEGPLRALLATYVKQMTKDAGRARWMKDESKVEQQ